MINFNIAGTVVDDLTTDLRGLSDIDIVRVGGRWVLLVASEADSAITTYELASDGTPTWADSQGYGSQSGTRTVWRLTYTVFENDLLVLPATRYEDQTALYRLADNGKLTILSSDSLSGQGLGLSEIVTLGGTDYIFARLYGEQSLTVYRLNGGLNLNRRQVLQDTDSVYLGDVSALAYVHIAGSDYLLVASGFDAGISSYLIDNNGRLSLVDAVGPADGTGFSRPQALEVLRAGGKDFVVMADAGTDSLILYRIDNTGNLIETDSLMDTLETRFQGASTLEGFQYQGRQFLVAAGSDDGITVLELWDDGTLHVEASLADTYDITLANVSGLSVEILNGVPVLFVSSATDHGFTRIELSIETIHNNIMGNASGNILTGTVGNDRVFAGAGDDVVDGGAGNDWLGDGSGADRLTGGAGADVFSFVPDGEMDVIVDFDPSQDVIEFSKFPTINSFYDLRIVEGCGAVFIYAAEEFLRLEAEHGAFGAQDLTADHFDF